jgi:hypothetical protein
MVRMLVGGVVLLALVVALAPKAEAQRGQDQMNNQGNEPKAKKSKKDDKKSDKKPGRMAKGTRYKVRSVDGDRITVAQKKGKKRTLTLSGDTKYVVHAKGKEQSLSADEAKKRLRKGASIRVEMGDGDSVRVVHFGSGKKAKNPRKSKSKSKSRSR